MLEPFETKRCLHPLFTFVCRYTAYVYCFPFSSYLSIERLVCLGLCFHGARLLLIPFSLILLPSLYQCRSGFKQPKQQHQAKAPISKQVRDMLITLQWKSRKHQRGSQHCPWKMPWFFVLLTLPHRSKCKQQIETPARLEPITRRVAIRFGEPFCARKLVMCIQ